MAQDCYRVECRSVPIIRKRGSDVVVGDVMHFWGDDHWRRIVRIERSSGELERRYGPNYAHRLAYFTVGGTSIFDDGVIEVQAVQ